MQGTREQEGASDKGSEGSDSHMEDKARHTSSHDSISAAVAEQPEAPGLEEAGGAGLQAASVSGSQCSLGQQLSPSTKGASRESSWTSLEHPGLEDQASLTTWDPSLLSVDSVELQEQAQATAYQAEDGATWVSQQARREVTNRSQQTSPEWSGTRGEALTYPGMGTLSIGAENPVSLKLVQQQPEQSALVPHSKVVMELKMGSGNLQGLEFVLGRNEQRQMFCIGFTDKAEQKQNVFPPTSDNLKSNLASEMVRSQPEQTSDTRMKMNQETAEKAVFQCSIAALEDAGGTRNLMTLKGGMEAGKGGRMMIISDEQMGNTVIQTIHETTQASPGSQQPPYSHDVSGSWMARIPQMCTAAEAELLQMMACQTWGSGSENRNAESASELLVAPGGPKDAQSVALPRGMGSGAQQTCTVICLNEGIWIKTETGKAVGNKNQQTSGSQE